MVNKIFTGVCIVLLLIIGYQAYSCVQYGKKKAVWEAEKERLNVEIADLQISRQVHEETAEKWKEKADAEGRARLEAEDELRRLREAHEIALANIAELTPDEVVSQTIQALGVASEKIYLSNIGVVFSLDVARTNLLHLKSLEFVLNQEVPRLKNFIFSLESENSSLRKANDELELALDDSKTEAIKWRGMYEGEFSLRLDCEKRFNIFSTKNILITVGVGVVVGGVFYFILK